MYSQEGNKRLQNFISACGDLHEAAYRLGLRPSSLEKMLNSRFISRNTQEKVEVLIGPIDHREPPPKQLHLPSFSARRDFDLLSKLKALIDSSGGAEAAAGQLGVRPSSITKILAGKMVSRSLLDRITMGLGHSERSNNFTPRPNPLVERLRKVYELYENCGTLEAVGRKMGLSRERVRQLLNSGSRLGLFEYKPYDYPYISREKLIADFSMHPSLDRVARANKVTVGYLRKLMAAHGISDSDIKEHKSKRRQSICLEEYQCIVNVLGHHPTTTELEADPAFRLLYNKIKRLWGSFDAFRNELNIPKPPQGSPTFNQDMQEWREHKGRVTFLLRMQHLDRIRECLQVSGPLSSSHVAYECGISQGRVLRLLPLLLATRDVVREGDHATTKYRFVMR